MSGQESVFLFPTVTFRAPGAGHAVWTAGMEWRALGDPRPRGATHAVRLPSQTGYAAFEVPPAARERLFPAALAIAQRGAERDALSANWALVISTLPIEHDATDPHSIPHYVLAVTDDKVVRDALVRGPEQLRFALENWRADNPGVEPIVDPVWAVEILNTAPTNAALGETEDVDAQKKRIRKLGIVIGLGTVSIGLVAWLALKLLLWSLPEVAITPPPRKVLPPKPVATLAAPPRGEEASDRALIAGIVSLDAAPPPPPDAPAHERAPSPQAALAVCARVADVALAALAAAPGWRLSDVRCSPGRAVLRWRAQGALQPITPAAFAELARSVWRARGRAKLALAPGRDAEGIYTDATLALRLPARGKETLAPKAATLARLRDTQLGWRAEAAPEVVVDSLDPKRLRLDARTPLALTAWYALYLDGVPGVVVEQAAWSLREGVWHLSATLDTSG